VVGLVGLEPTILPL